MKSTDSTTINVFLWGGFVGKLSWDKDAMRSVFSFSEEYIDAPYDISPLRFSKHKLKAQSFYGDKAFEGLPAFLADSLPDDWGNTLFDKWTSEQEIPFNENRSLLKLSFIGKRGMGALEFVPSLDIERSPENIDLASLYDLSLQVLRDREKAHLNTLQHASLKQLIALGTSAGGKHAKGVIAMNSKQEVRSGQVELPADFRYYLLKFKEDANVPSCEIEKIFYDMAVDSGIRMMPSQILTVDGTNHFLTERFDRRSGGEKIHVQSLRALSPSANDYMNLFWICDSLKVPAEQKEELFRRMVFNFLAGVTDDHSRNFSFMMEKNGQWQLSPAYDVVFTANVWANPAAEAHSLGMWQKRAHITDADFVDFGEDIGIGHCREIVHDVRRSISTFPERCDTAGVDAYWRNLIWNVIKSL